MEPTDLIADMDNPPPSALSLPSETLEATPKPAAGSALPTSISLPESTGHPKPTYPQHQRGLSFHEPVQELEYHARSGLRAPRSRSTTWSTLASSFDSGAVTSTESEGGEAGSEEGFWAARTESEPSSWGFSEPASSLASRWKGKAPVTAEQIASAEAHGDRSPEATDHEAAPMDKGKARAVDAEQLHSNPSSRPTTAAGTSRSPSIAFVDSFPAGSWSGPASTTGLADGSSSSGHRRSILRSRSPSISLPAQQQRTGFRSSPAPSRPPTPGVVRTEVGSSASLFQDAIENAARGRRHEPGRARALSMGYLTVPGASTMQALASRSRSRSGERSTSSSRLRERIPAAASLPASAAPSRPPSTYRNSILGLGGGGGRSGSSRRGLFRRRASDMTLGRAGSPADGSRASSLASSSRFGNSAPQTPLRPGTPNGDGQGSTKKPWRKVRSKVKRALSRGSSASNLVDLAPSSEEGPAAEEEEEQSRPPPARMEPRPPIVAAATTAFEGDGFPFPRVQRPSSPLANPVIVNGDLSVMPSRDNGYVNGETTNGYDGFPAAMVLKGMKPDDAANSRYLTRPVRSMSAPLLHPQQQAALASLGAFYDAAGSSSHLFDIDRFDLLLPRELRIAVFAALVDLCASEGGDRRREDARWVGRAEGVRELVKCSRVSKTWLDLTTDGQLWRRVGGGVMGPGGMGLDGLCRLMKGAGPFVKELRLKGLGSGLTSMAMLRIADEAVALEDNGKVVTGLTGLDLTGCRSISTQSLHYLLSRSSHLVNLTLKGLPAVTDSTCDLLRSLGAPIAVLDMRNCPHMSAMAFVRACESFSDTLRVLQVGRLRFFDDFALTELGRAAPDLEVLDISYNNGLTDAGFRSFVAGPGVVASPVLHPLTREQKRETRLRKLNVSSCKQLTDKAFEALAFAVPSLRVLEAANIGSEVKDAGLIALLSTTPSIEKLDLEDANEITDRVLYAITPTNTARSNRLRGRSGSNNDEAPQTGQFLDHLVLSYAVHLSDTALVSLIRACPRLRVLELDNTRVGDGVVKQFVKLSRQRAIRGAELGAVDARGVSRTVVGETEGFTRTRRGRRGWWAKQMEYSNGRGVAEFDDAKVIVHTFWSWSRLDEHQRQRAAARALPTHGARGIEQEEGAAAGLWGVLGFDTGRRPNHRRQSSNCIIM